MSKDDTKLTTGEDRNSEDKESEGEKSTEYRANAFKSFIGGIGEIATSIRYSFMWFLTWLEEQHAIVQGLAILPIMAGFRMAGDVLAGILSSIFWESSVTIQRDIIIENFPFPMGLTLYFLISALVLSHLLSAARISKLKDRVEELESE